MRTDRPRWELRSGPGCAAPEPRCAPGRPRDTKLNTPCPPARPQVPIIRASLSTDPAGAFLPCTFRGEPKSGSRLGESSGTRRPLSRCPRPGPGRRFTGTLPECPGPSEGRSPPPESPSPPGRGGPSARFLPRPGDHRRKSRDGGGRDAHSPAQAPSAGPTAPAPLPSTQRRIPVSRRYKASAAA